MSIAAHLNQGSKRLIANSLFLIANTLAGSFFGFLFWIVAAKRFSAAEVGVGSAFISSVTLLTAFSDMGLGIAFIRFLPSMKEKDVDYVNSSLLAVAIFTLLFGAVFIVGMPLWAPELRNALHSFYSLGIFFLSLLSFSLVQFLDRLYITFQTTQYMFFRNLLANVIKISAIFLFLSGLGAIGLLFSVGISAIITLFLSLLWFAPKVMKGYHPRLKLDQALLKRNAAYTIGNHFSQLLWSAPPLIYPLIILALLSPGENAYFYISWMIANLLFVIPTAVSTSTFANMANQGNSDEKGIWRTMRLTLLGLIPISITLIFLADFLLGFFGQDYITACKSLFTVLTVSVFPFTVNSYLLTYYRLQNNSQKVIRFSGFIALISISLIIMFGSSQGLVGIGYGWGMGQLLGSAYGLFDLRKLFKVALAPQVTSNP